MEDLYIETFSLSPNPNHLYITNGLKSAIYQAKGTIRRRQGLVAILGDAGMGKSTVMRYLFGEMDAREDTTATLLPTPQFPSLLAMIKTISNYFGVPIKRSLIDQQAELERFLVEEYRAGRNVVVFIDEAQLLSNQLLEGVRALMNFETNSAKLVQIVLAGQLELKTRLEQEKNAALWSRIHTYTILNPLTERETVEMIRFRCKQSDLENPFTNEALEKIWEITGGIPRKVLKVCDKAYDYMQLKGADKIGIEYVEPAAEDAAVKKAGV